MTSSNIYTQQIISLLTPLVGDFMAKGIIKSQIQKMGKTEEQIGKSDLPHLADEIGKGLAVFIGSDLAKKVTEKIKTF